MLEGNDIVHYCQKQIDWTGGLVLEVDQIFESIDNDSIEILDSNNLEKGKLENIYIESIHGPAAAAGFGDGVELGVLDDRDVPEAGAQHLSTNHSSVLQIPTNQRSVITYHF